MWFTIRCHTAGPSTANTVWQLTWKATQQASTMENVCLCDGGKALPPAPK